MSYSRVTYVRTNFNYFTTNHTVNNDIKLEMEFEIASVSGSSANNCIFGNWQNGYNSRTSLIFNAHTSRGMFRCYAGGYYNDDVSKYTIGDRYRNTIDRTSFVINNLTSTTSYTQNINRTISNTSNPIYIANGGQSTETSDIKVYEAIIYSGDTIVGHYFPYKDNETGYGVLYDSVSDTYLTGSVPSGITAGDPVFGPDTDSLTFEYSGGTQSITLVSDSPWTATTNGWITLSQYSGETGGVINVTVANNIFSPKIGSITFTDGENTAIVSVEQKGDSRIILKNLYRNGNKVKQMWRNGEKLYQMFERFFFDVDTESIEFEYSGSTTTITINASEPWTMTLPEWISASTISGIGSATVTLTTTQNPTEDAQTGSIVITCEGRTITIPVEQKGSVGLSTPLTFEILSDGYINWKWNYSSAAAKTIEYRINKGEWTSITSTSSGVHIDVVEGDKVEFRGNNASYSDGVQNHNNIFSGTTCQFNLYGNIMSLINSTDFEDLDTLTGSYNFARMFYNVTGIRSIENFYLPATGLTVGCYRSLFDTCTGITDASMLVLPATTLKQQCYNNLLTHCKELTKAPTLSASTLTTECYGGAFNDCPKLTYMKCLATSNINTNSSTISWMRSVGSGGTFVKKRGVSWPSGENGIPSGWTVIEVDE